MSQYVAFFLAIKLILKANDAMQLQLMLYYDYELYHRYTFLSARQQNRVESDTFRAKMEWNRPTENV